MNKVLRVNAFLMLLGLSAGTCAMTAIDDQEMSEISGTGLAFGLEDVRIQAGPTTYFEATGTVPSAGPFKRGDVRWYGFALSGSNPVTSWGGTCGAGINGMGCPIGDTIDNLAAFDNPYILRVFDYNAQPSGALTRNYSGAPTSQAVLEYLAPTNADPYRYAAWIEIVVGANIQDKIQGQAIMTNAKLNSSDGKNSKIRIVKHTDPSDPTVGFIWENHWQGDFRYSVNQTFFSPDTAGVTPFYTDVEGAYALNIQTFVPLGQLFYQSIILDDLEGVDDGNFRIELTRPNPLSADVYEDFYSIAGQNGYQRGGRSARYGETHGYFRIGDWTPACRTGNVNCTTPMAGTKNGVQDTTDGLFFVAYDQFSTSARFNAFSDREAIYPNGQAPGGGNSDIDNISTIPRLNNSNNNNYNQINLGDSRIEGILFQHFELRTRGI